MKKFKKIRKKAIILLAVMFILFAVSLILTAVINEKMAGLPIGFICCLGLLKSIEKVLEA